MVAPTPQFILYASADERLRQQEWRFCLQSRDGQRSLEASDTEQGESVCRLELLAVIRGLEALDEPSDVTLVTSSHYVRRGIRLGLEDWRAANWRWERFGVMVPVSNADLWQRLDQALRIHNVKCRGWRLDRPRHKQMLRGPHFLRRRREADRTPNPADIQPAKQAS